MRPRPPSISRTTSSGGGCSSWPRAGGPEVHQALAYDLAHAAAEVEMARSMLDYGAKGDLEARLTCAFVAEALHDLGTRLIGRQAVWGLDDDAPLAGARDFLDTYRHPDFQADLATTAGARHLDPDFELVQDSFRAFADKEIAPVAEHVHRTNGDVPESIIAGLADMGAFGLSVPGRVRRVVRGGRQRVPGHGRRHRGAVPGVARHRRLAHHPAGDPHPGPRRGAAPRNRSRSGCPSWRPGRSWSRWP